MTIHRLFFTGLLAAGLRLYGASAGGISNFERVDAVVYRGAQPTDEGFKYLATLGVKTVIDLREADARGQAEQRTVTAAGMNYVNVPMTGLTPPTQAQITQILTLLERDSAGALFVHCKSGVDRTGAVIAAYHIDHDGWENARALNDAMSHGMGRFQFPRQNYIRNFQPRKPIVAESTAGEASKSGSENRF